MDSRRSAISSSASSQEMAAEASLAFRSRAPQRVEQPVGRIFAFEIASHLAAKEPAGDRVSGVAAKLRSTRVVVDVDEKRAGVRAIESADGMGGADHV